MIVRLSGKVDFVGDDCVHVQAGDVVRELLVPAADVPFLQTKTGQVVTFFTLEYLDGNPSFGNLVPRMIGFLRNDDREFFHLFTTVKNIGTKKALKALAVPTGQIASAIALKDAKKLSELPGVGRRVAEQIIAELHGKVDAFATHRADGPPGSEKGSPALADHQAQAVEVLVKLGERRAEAENWVERVCTVDPTMKDAQKVVQAVYRLKAGAR
jgi:holliday junction DNA helicase RuvA